MVERTLFNNFSSGEASPRISAQIGERRYGSSCRQMLNFRGLAQGPVQYCAGTEYAGEVKDSADRTWLVPFRYSPDQSYQLEFGDQYVRIWRDHGQLLDGGGSPVEVATPYAVADLTSADGTLALRFYQSGDSLFITHPDYWPRELQRTGALTWTLTKFEPDDGPFDDENTTATTVYASAGSGTVTLTASASIFAATDVDSLFYLEGEELIAAPWRAGESGIGAGVVRRVDTRIYQESGVGGTAGTATPSHITGSATDGGLTWEYVNDNSGWVRITGYTSGTQVTATALTQLPGSVVTSSYPTRRWRFGSWSETRGFPRQVTIFRERLVFEQALKLQVSRAGIFREFGFRTAGEITPADGFTRRINGDGVSVIHALVPKDRLQIFADGGELSVQEITANEPFGPENATVAQQTNYRSRNMAALPVNDVTFFVQPSGEKVREYVFEYNRDGYRGYDMTFLAEHIAHGGIVDLAFCAEPVPTLWALRADGVLLQMVYERDNEVVGWSQRIIGGDGFVESISSIPNPDDGSDDLWMIVRRTIDGATQRYVEWLHQPLEAETDQPQDGWYLDCAVQYSGSATDAISGLGHLEGETVSVLADGFVHADVTVSSGAVTLDFEASKVLIGYAYQGVVETQRPTGDGRMGATLGFPQRYSSIIVDYYASAAGSRTRIGTPNDLASVNFRLSSDDLNAPTPLRSGTYGYEAVDGWHYGEPLRIEQYDPLPLMVRAINARVRVGG